MAAKVSGGGKGKFTLGQNADINVTPFVDVMLVLLIIFMVTAPLATVSIKLDLPPAKAPPPDAHQKPPHEIAGEEYRALMKKVIVASRKDAGWRFPWFVAEASYHTPDDTETPEIRAAQASLWRAGLALEGPDTDQLTGMNRQNHGTGVHMSDMGLQAHGKLWAAKVGPWLDSVLAH